MYFKCKFGWWNLLGALSGNFCEKNEPVGKGKSFPTDGFSVQVSGKACGGSHKSLTPDTVITDLAHGLRVPPRENLNIFL
jgi:hypothetical protein